LAEKNIKANHYRQLIKRLLRIEQGEANSNNPTNLSSIFQKRHSMFKKLRISLIAFILVQSATAQRQATGNLLTENIPALDPTGVFPNLKFNKDNRRIALNITTKENIEN